MGAKSKRKTVDTANRKTRSSYLRCHFELSISLALVRAGARARRPVFRFTNKEITNFISLTGRMTQMQKTIFVNEPVGFSSDSPVATVNTVSKGLGPSEALLWWADSASWGACFDLSWDRFWIDMLKYFWSRLILLALKATRSRGTTTAAEIETERWSVSTSGGDPVSDQLLTDILHHEAKLHASLRLWEFCNVYWEDGSHERKGELFA